VKMAVRALKGNFGDYEQLFQFQHSNESLSGRACADIECGRSRSFYVAFINRVSPSWGFLLQMPCVCSKSPRTSS
jgi:hypothetical protein